MGYLQFSEAVLLPQGAFLIACMLAVAPFPERSQGTAKHTEKISDEKVRIVPKTLVDYQPWR